MSHESIKCMKCGTEMEEGFIRDSALGSHGVAHWVPSQSNPAKDKTEQRKTKTYRCPKCGYIESYAP